MSSSAATDLNSLLHRYYSADSGRADQLLGELGESVRPVVRRFLARKGIRGEDLEDRCSDSVTRVVLAVRASREPGGKQIRDVTGLAIALSRNLYIDHVRSVNGHWRPLRIMVGKILTGSERGNPFDRWNLRTFWLGGFKKWTGQPCRATSKYVALWEDDSDFRRDGLANRHPDEVRLPELLLLFFQWIETPVEEAELVTHVAALRTSTQMATVSMDELTEEYGSDGGLMPAARDEPETEVLDAMALADFGARLWAEVEQLRPLQRAALLLGMESEDWTNLGWSPIMAAEAAGLARDEILPVWRELPLTDKAIAARLEVTEIQVSNLRKCARERLRRKFPNLM